MMSLTSLTGAFLATVARQHRREDPKSTSAALEAEVRRLTKKNEKLERSQLILMEHIEIVNDELRVARMRLDEQRQANRLLLESHARAAQHYEQRMAVHANQLYHQQLAAQQYQNLCQLSQQQAQCAQAQYAQLPYGGDCTCIPGRAALLRGGKD